MTLLAGIVVLLTGLWLVGFAFYIVFRPEGAKRVLGGFASSARAHFLEQALRLVAGSGFVLFASELRFSDLMRGFGWILIVTTVGLIVTPWRWHQRFAQWAIPFAVRRIKLDALGSFLLGAFILYAMLPG